MRHSAEMRRCLEECDVPGIRKLWLHIAPNLPQPDSDAEALIMLHRARTETHSIPLRARAYSHRWLIDNSYPSGLPDNLKPRAERMYPCVSEGVGISVNFSSSILRPAAKLVQGAMSDAVEECYADKRTEPEFVKARMREAKEKEMKRLFGAIV